jgi:hypothetical protein
MQIAPRLARTYPAATNSIRLAQRHPSGHVNPTERQSRRTLNLPRTTDVPRPSTAQADNVVPARRAERKVSPLEKRVGQLTAQKREAQEEVRAARAQAAYWRGAAVAVLDAVNASPELHARAVVAAWVGALESVAESDPAIAAALHGTAPQLSPQAAAILLRDVAAGPAVVAALASNPELAARIAALEPVSQALQIGRIAAEVAPASGRSEPPELPSIFSLFTSRSNK